MNFEFSRGKDCRGRPVDFRTSVYKNRLRVLQKLANIQITAIRGGAVPKRSEGMKRKRNPEKPGFCDRIAKSRPNYKNLILS